MTFSAQTSTVQRYEQLTGGREEQAQKTAFTAAEAYFAEQVENKTVPTFSGLRSAVKGALAKTFGEKPKPPPPKPREPDLLIHVLYLANYGAEKANFDPYGISEPSHGKIRA